MLISSQKKVEEEQDKRWQAQLIASNAVYQYRDLTTKMKTSLKLLDKAKMELM